MASSTDSKRRECWPSRESAPRPSRTSEKTHAASSGLALLEFLTKLVPLLWAHGPDSLQVCPLYLHGLLWLAVDAGHDHVGGAPVAALDRGEEGFEDLVAMFLGKLGSPVERRAVPAVATVRIRLAKRPRSTG
jgi:hypothetical protein